MGKTAGWFLKEGKPAPDELVTELVLAHLSSPECAQKGWVLDGFPRSTAQAKALSAAGQVPQHVLAVKGPEHGSSDEEQSSVFGARLEAAQESIAEMTGLYWNVCHVFRVNRPLEFVFEDVRRVLDRQPWQLMVAGAPGTGKGKLVSYLNDSLGLVHVTKSEVLSANKGSEAGVKAQEFVEAGGVGSVPDRLLHELLVTRLTQEDCKTRGFLLDGWPCEKSSYQLLVHSGFDPLMAVLSMSEADSLEAQVHIRYGVDTHKKYHLKTNPPPPGTEVRVNAVNLPDHVKKKHEDFTFAINGVLAVTKTDVLHVDATQELDEVVADVLAWMYASVGAAPRKRHERVAPEPQDPQLHSAAVKIQADFRGHRERMVPISDRRVAISGPPASGKGTQCSNILRQYRMVHVTLGGVIRDNVARDTELGQKARAANENNTRLPDADLVSMVAEALGSHECKKRGWLLDGFPRTAAQAGLLLGAGFGPEAFITLDVPADVCVERALRKDDIAERVAQYQAEVGEMAVVFKDCLYKIDGAQNPEIVFDGIRRVVEKKPWKLLVAGPPGSGKGEQMMALVSKLGVTHLNVAVVVQAAAKAGSEHGEQAMEFIKQKQPLPDELVAQLVSERVAAPDVLKTGWLMDGLPSNTNQVDLLKAAGVKPDKVLKFDLTDETILSRAQEKQLDPDTQKLYTSSEQIPEEVAARLVPLMSAEDVQGSIDQYRSLEAALDAAYGNRVLMLQGDQQDLCADMMAELYASVIKTDKLKKAREWTRPVRMQPNGQPWRLFIAGAPGSGKGKLCEWVHQEFGLSHLSHATLTKAAKQLDAELGARAAACLKQDFVLSTELTIEVLQLLSTQGESAKHGWLLDGFPRTVEQAEAVKAAGLQVDHFINLDVPVDELVAKLCTDDSGNSEESVRAQTEEHALQTACLLYTSPSPRDRTRSRMPSSA
eukprot:TRINITY_DN18108_c0_g1_i1.p1 TRINITY_DN18108_c0_g1~~TRINITY_DN18108_c0_g1_i1.p1  ORF type:complete len:939 (+),score=304.85 TRINITY_DN18108_c0_g1_i1:173-2989(+)